MKFSAVFGLLCLGLIAVRAHAVPVGMAANVKGQVAVVVGGKKTPLKLLGRLEPGTTITSGPNSSAVIVLFKDGARYQLGANKSAKISASGVTGAQKLSGLSGPSAGAVKLLADARVGAIMARPPGAFKPLMPTTLDYFETSTPRFSWGSIPGATQYTFTLFDSADNVIWSVSTSDLSATYPMSAPRLVEKQPYLWQVTGFKNSRPLLGNLYGMVTVLSSHDARELDALTSKLRAEAAKSSDNTPLLLLVEAYRSYGVAKGALDVLTGPLSGQPGVDDAYNDLVDSLSPFARVWAGRPVPAYAAYQGTR